MLPPTKNNDSDEKKMPCIIPFGRASVMWKAMSWYHLPISSYCFAVVVLLVVYKWLGVVKLYVAKIDVINEMEHNPHILRTCMPTRLSVVFIIWKFSLALSPISNKHWIRMLHNTSAMCTNDQLIFHYSDVIMGVRSPASRLFTQPFIQAQIKKTSKLRVTGLF